MKINQKNVVNVACVGGCIYWIAIFLSMFVDLVTQSSAKDHVTVYTVIFSTFAGAAFYAMIIWAMIAPSSERDVTKKWLVADAILGFSPLPFIILWVAVIMHKIVTQ
jgi:hypothetical protein